MQQITIYTTERFFKLYQQKRIISQQFITSFVSGLVLTDMEIWREN